MQTGLILLYLTIGMSTNTYSISKTSFIKFEQCSKAFFLYKNYPYLRDKLSIDKQITFKRGHDVGLLAQQLFPGGIDVSRDLKNLPEVAEATQKLISEAAPVIYEATFIYKETLIMVDILVLENGVYNAYEVKSSIKVSDTYYKDACLQYYVLKNSLNNFDDLFLVTINPDYVLEDELDVKKLFRKRSVKKRAEENIAYFDHRVSEALMVLEQNTIPNTPIGKQCFKPYQCDFFGTCWKDLVTENSVLNLPQVDRGLLFDWFSSGIKTISQLNDDLIEKENVKKIKNAILTNSEIRDAERINHFISKITEPVASMDMEIWNPAVPQLKGTKPFEQIPFLVCFYDGNTRYFFTDQQTDKRKEFGEKLIEFSKDYKTILVYDKTMEVAVINTLIQLYPELKPELDILKTKMLDVFELFLNLSYYHPGFGSNVSLKVVSATLLNDVAYSKINSGLEAMAYYGQYRISENELERSTIFQDLVDYCSTDTEATFKLARFLQK
ncbi:MAG: DUF2779 domain-containing protein [Bacteroidia bacterium]|nr:DUF2779 domain-containing protein [Bacteroidia bacterium]